MIEMTRRAVVVTLAVVFWNPFRPKRWTLYASSSELASSSRLSSGK